MFPEQWVRDITDEAFKCSSKDWKKGDRVKHPDGREVEIVDGQYWGTYGLSNHWYWCEVKEDGTLGNKENGYGW